MIGHWLTSIFMSKCNPNWSSSVGIRLLLISTYLCRIYGNLTQVPIKVLINQYNGGTHYSLKPEVKVKLIEKVIIIHCPSPCNKLNLTVKRTKDANVFITSGHRSNTSLLPEVLNITTVQCCLWLHLLRSLIWVLLSLVSFQTVDVNNHVPFPGKSTPFLNSNSASQNFT